MDDEIDLRVYAELLWRARYVIVGVTLGAALVAFVLSRFFLPKVYEASALVVVESPVTLDRGQVAMRLRPDGALVLDEQPVAPVQVVSLTPAGYQEIVESDAFRTLLRQQIANPSSGLSQPDLTLRARVVPQTSILELTVEASRPDWAAEWVNQAAALLLKEAEQLNEARMSRALELLERQLEQSRKALEDAQARLQTFIEQGPPVERLRNEQSVKLKIMGDFEAKIASLNTALASETKKLESLRARLAQQPRTVTLRRALLPYSSGVPTADGSRAAAPAQGVTQLQYEELNPVYVQLQEQVATQEATVAALNAEKQSLEAALADLAKELQELSSELARTEAELQDLTWQADAARRNYETALSQYEAQRTMLAARIGSSSLTLVRPATPPEAPARPKVLLNSVVAGFLALMVSVVGVFVAELWRQPVMTEPRQGAGDAAHGA